MKPAILKIIVLASLVSAVNTCSAITVRDDPAAAAAYNQMGVDAYQKGAYKAAISYLEQALKLNRGDKTVENNLAVAYASQSEAEYERRNLDQAGQYAQKALNYDGKNITALYVLGEVKYNSQKLEEAKALWQKILDIEPDFKYAEELKKRISKADTENKVEKEYRASGMDQFDIRYAKEGARTSYNVRYYLQEAYRILGQEFGLQPQYKITVILYDRDDFEAVRDWKKGASGIYDGKIRLPFVGSGFSSEDIRGIIWHEYTHLLVNDLSLGKAPDWMHEGLAYYEGYKYAKKNLTILKNAVKNGLLLPFGELDTVLGSTTDEVQYHLAAQESYSLAKYLMKRYNKYTIREVLKLLGTGMTFEEVAKKKLYVTTKELQKRWFKELGAGELY
jgi:tetratricopeptide (TPR) repeat protein